MLDADRLMVDHVQLVRNLARFLVRSRRLPPCVDSDDLEGYGMFGLIRAARRYKPADGLPFEPLASRYIINAMLDGMRQMDWLTRKQRQDAPHAQVEEYMPARDRRTVPFEYPDEFDVMIAGLTPRAQQLLKLRYQQHMESRDIAHAIGCSSPQWVAELHRRAIQALRAAAANNPAE